MAERMSWTRSSVLMSPTLPSGFHNTESTGMGRDVSRPRESYFLASGDMDLLIQGVSQVNIDAGDDVAGANFTIH
jgi:hypothetical protein